MAPGLLLPGFGREGEPAEDGSEPLRPPLLLPRFEVSGETAGTMG